MCKHLWFIAIALSVIYSAWCPLTHARSATSNSYSNTNGITTTQDAATTQRKETNFNHLQANSPGIIDSGGGGATIWKDLSLMFRIYQQCASENLSICLKVKLLTGLEKAFRQSKTLKLIEGVQFVNAIDDTEDQTTRRNGAKAILLSEKDIEATLPRALDAKEHVLNNLIFKKLAGFLQDHTLQVKFPDIRAMDLHDSANTIEGRKKKDKKGGGAYIMIPLLLGGTFIPIAYGALAMLAGKALIVSKLALVLASIIGIKKLLSGGGAKESHSEVVVSSGGHSGWGRDFDLAYSGWKPGKETAAAGKDI